VPLRLILVDHAVARRAALAKVLRLHPKFALVGEADDGEAAISLAREHQPDFIVLDLGLPDIEGSDVLAGLRAAAPDALVVAYGDSRTPERAALSRCVDAYVDKPQDLNVVVDLLDELGGRTTRSATMRLGQDAREVALARRFVVEHCIDWDRPATVDAAAIVASELVTNAFVHVQSDCELTVELRGDLLRIEVADHGRSTPDLQDTTLDDEHGRGLLLVNALCAAWGSEPRDDGKVVWAELPTRRQGVERRPRRPAPEGAR
jgi:DNA-binding response OmpR family regulator